ncbi:hypothetical protein QQS21_010933 [Conoideocrella luteorostrata]|uniref:Oxidase ustYa n=1 Tax=Conoideocrella luteorostrata TaxID=1105319 RepID=A0AAJ0FU72_9HYPO|nr:hypothetical protein QQS21_010933 [Conoideocrella luteorostrata]
MWLLLVILARFVAQSPCECPFRLPTESLLGDSKETLPELNADVLAHHFLVAWKAKVLDQDERFVTTDPGDIDGSNVTAIWGDIYPSAWIAVPDPSRVGFGGGVNLLRDAQDPGVWDAKTEGFSVAVMHQLHCIAVVKHSFMVYRRNEMGNHDVKIEHIDHCVEYLRQAIICHGDLTLERPETQTYPQGTTGWGNVHQCRDWDQLISVLRKLSIVRGDEGWIKAT